MRSLSETIVGAVDPTKPMAICISSTKYHSELPLEEGFIVCRDRTEDV